MKPAVSCQSVSQFFNSMLNVVRRLKAQGQNTEHISGEATDLSAINAAFQAGREFGAYKPEAEKPGKATVVDKFSAALRAFGS